MHKSTSESRDASNKPLHLHFHLPRCAGQTIHRHLSRHAARGTYFRAKKRRGPGRLFGARYQLDGMPQPETLLAVGGHWIGPSVERHFGGRPILRSILLRDPVSHFISYYNFRMMRYLSQGLRTYPVEIAYHARQRDFITHYLLRNFAEMSWPQLLSMSPQEKRAAADRLLSSFWFVGDYRDCDELVAALAPNLDVPATNERRNSSDQWQERVGWRPLTQKDLTPSMVRQIRQENALDQSLWETWSDVAQATPHLPALDTQDMSLVRFATVQSLRLINQVRRRNHRGWRIPAETGPIADGTMCRPGVPLLRPS